MTDPQPWYADHANLVLLTAHMAESGYDASEVARAVEKPWAYADEYQLALLELSTGA
ncbi:MAG: hypothetical protein JWO67_4536 [Streptosporangiaceae bacterium]|nr:hypothetical protein [Streptosporangiaceae bacterium]